jgi:peptidyl-tRNA hydrolase, PTH1 family
MFGRERRGASADWLVVGLCNPGTEYAGTRHNVGADAVERLARRSSATLGRSREKARVAEVRIHDRRVVLAAPTTYMNLSGEAVALLVRRHGLAGIDRLIVVHDELDLPSGRVKLKVGGGLAGHNGLASIKQHLKSVDFVRVRIGIGKPPGTMRGADWVLRKPGKAERAELDVATEEAADAVELVIDHGVAAAMNRVNIS